MRNMKFKRGKDIKKSIGIGRTVLDDLKEHPVARPMNSPWDDVDLHKDPNASVWINPHNQFCFNSMWCTPEILEQWMEGEGPMVKGKTKAEKKKFWDYAVFEDGKDKWGIDHSRYLIKYKWKWFDKMTTDFNPHNHGHSRGGGMIATEIKTPLKLKPNRTRDQLQNKIRTEEAIVAMYAPFVDYIVRELEYRDWQDVRREVESDLYGVSRTLYCLGYGSMGACNTPEEISNLSWVKDVVFAKGIYLHYVKNDVDLPDFEFLCHPDRDKFTFEDEKDE